MAQVRRWPFVECHKRKIARCARPLMILMIAFELFGPASSASAVEGGNYTSAEFGWSVVFDDEVWEATELGPPLDTVMLLTDGALATLGTGTIWGESADKCLESEQERYQNEEEGYSKYSPVKQLDKPVNAASSSILFNVTWTFESDSFEFLYYVECRPMKGAVLTMQIDITEDDYPRVLPEIEKLLDGITVLPPRSPEVTPTAKAGQEQGEESNREIITLAGSSGSSPSKRVTLEVGQYRVAVRGTASDDFGGLFSVTIEGAGYYELPINDVIDASGPYSSSSDVYIESSGSATVSVTTLGLDDWTLTLTPVGSSGGGQDDEDEASTGSGSGGQGTVTITGTNGSSPSKRVNLEAGQYHVDVHGTAADRFGGLFSVTIEGAGYYELPINEVIDGAGAYSATSEVYIDASGSATISVTTLGLDDWTLTLTLVDPA